MSALYSIIVIGRKGKWNGEWREEGHTRISQYSCLPCSEVFAMKFADPNVLESAGM